jgi:hypothetical protein
MNFKIIFLLPSYAIEQLWIAEYESKFLNNVKALHEGRRVGRVAGLFRVPRTCIEFVKMFRVIPSFHNIAKSYSPLAVRIILLCDFVVVLFIRSISSE